MTPPSVDAPPSLFEDETPCQRRFYLAVSGTTDGRDAQRAHLYLALSLGTGMDQPGVAHKQILPTQRRSLLHSFQPLQNTAGSFSVILPIIGSVNHGAYTAFNVLKASGSVLELRLQLGGLLSCSPARAAHHPH